MNIQDLKSVVQKNKPKFKLLDVVQCKNVDAERVVIIVIECAFSRAKYQLAMKNNVLECKNTIDFEYSPFSLTYEESELSFPKFCTNEEFSKIKTCICHNADHENFQMIYLSVDIESRYAVKCLTCAMIGKIGNTPVQAIDLWNKRIDNGGYDD